MNIESLAVYYQLRESWEIIFDFPIDLVSGEGIEKPEEKEPVKGKLSLDQLMKADLGMLSDEELEAGIKVAADAEEYRLASRLRDELKGRKDGGSNG